MRGIPGYNKGVNLGGWLSQFECFTSPDHFDTFITEEDIKRISQMGLDHVRVPVDYTIIETEEGEIIESGYKHIDDCVAWCEKYGINMIIDLHKTFGYSFDPLDDTDKTIFFHDEKLQARFFALWTTIAKRYESKAHMLAFELLNEIVFPEISNEWNQIALKATEHIRKYAPKSWVIFGGTRYNAVISVPELPMTDDPYVAYTFHCYEPLIFTHQGAYWVKRMPLDFRIAYPQTIEEYRKASLMLDQNLVGAINDPNVPEIGPEFFEYLFKAALDTADERNIPLYCGEYGVIDRATPEDTIRWLDDIHSVFEKYEIGRAYWNWKEKDYDIAGDRCKNFIDELASRL